MKSGNKRLTGEKTMLQRIISDMDLTLLCIPGLICLLIFNYLPMFGVVIAFKDYKPLLGIMGSEWVGFKNFEFFFASQDAFRIIRNTLLYSFTFIVTDCVFGVMLAIMFYFLHSSKALKFYNTIIIIPRFMSIIMIAFMVYALLNPAQGIVNQFLSVFGIESVQWYMEPVYWPFILTTVHIWSSVGMGSVIYYSSLMGMDETMLEAAEIDGASLRHKIFNIIIPYLIPIVVIQTILAIGRIFSGDFGLFYQVPQNVGVLYPTTDIINTYTYRALESGNLAKSAAVGLFQSAAGFIMVMLTNFIVRKISPENALF